MFFTSWVSALVKPYGTTPMPRRPSHKRVLASREGIVDLSYVEYEGVRYERRDS